MIDKCVKCSHSINGNRIGLYFADDDSHTLPQRLLSRMFKVDEGYICTVCWDALKKTPKFKLRIHL